MRAIILVSGPQTQLYPTPRGIGKQTPVYDNPTIYCPLSP
jgi:dTDP-glucose pyrophosphorylase